MSNHLVQDYAPTMEPRPFPAAPAAPNPYRRALLTVGTVGLTVGIIFGLVGNSVVTSSYGETDATVLFIWAGIFALVGTNAVLLWLHSSALAWIPRTRR